MPCLLVILALLLPRLTIFLVWMFTDWLQRAFTGALLPILGFLFVPYTTLAYMAAMINNHNSVSGFWLVVVIVAVLVDLSHLGLGTRVRR